MKESAFLAAIVQLGVQQIEDDALMSGAMRGDFRIGVIRVCRFGYRVELR